MIQETVKVNVSSPEVIENATIYVRKYNRTFDALNSTATFKVWLNDSIFVSKLIRSLPKNYHIIYWINFNSSGPRKEL